MQNGNASSHWLLLDESEPPHENYGHIPHHFDRTVLRFLRMQIRRAKFQVEIFLVLPDLPCDDIVPRLIDPRHTRVRTSLASTDRREQQEDCEGGNIFRH